MIVVYDIETFSNCFTYMDYNPETQEENMFVIWDKQNDTEKLIAYLEKLRKDKYGMVGFNNIHFDWPILHYIWNSDRITAEKIYNRAQSIISEEKKQYVEELIPQLDLFLLNHYDNKARRTSLKALEVSCGWDNVMDMPMHHTETIDEHKLSRLIEYNRNDVRFTAKFYEMCKEKIDLRKQIGKKYKLKVINKSDVVIGENIFLKYLSEAMGTSIRDLSQIRGKRADVPLKDIIFPYVKFRDPKLKYLLGLMRQTTSSSNYLQNFVEGIVTSMSTNDLAEKFEANNIAVRKLAQVKKSFSFSINYAGLHLDYGVGGIHGCITPGVYESTETDEIIDIDVKSYYPNLFIQNRLHPRQMDQDVFVNVYNDIFNERVKAQIDGDKLTSDALKLALNGVFGKTGSDVSCFYDPFVFFAVTVNGQLLITMLVEALVEAGASLLQVNTDGVTIRASRKKKEQILAVCKKWEQDTKLTLEYAEYSKMIIRDVNNYIAVSTSGKVKEKGAFETKKDWHKDNTFMIIPLAVREYFVNGTPVEKTIREHKNILDFCGRYKATPGWSVDFVYLDGTQEKRINFGKIYRYLPVKSGGTSLKVNKDGREHHLCEGFQTMPFNRITDFDWNNLNFTFFELECQKLIQTIQPTQLSLL